MHCCAGIQAETGVNRISDCDPIETAVEMVPWCTSIQTASDDMWGISECDPMARFQCLAWYHDIVPAADHFRHPPILGEWREGESEGGGTA